MIPHIVSIYVWSTGNLTTVNIEHKPIISALTYYNSTMFLARLVLNLFLVITTRTITTSSLAMKAASASSSPFRIAAAARNRGLFFETPLIRSIPLSRLCQRDVYLKLDCLQASGSFKDRGMAHLCHTLQEEQGVTEIISSSGGNAGLAAATVGQMLGLKVQVIVPKTTKALVIEKLKSLGAVVTVHGDNWNQADDYTRKQVGEQEHAAYISPYDHPLLWTGHSSLVEEIQHQLVKVRDDGCGAGGAAAAAAAVDPAAVLVSVGGGGLLCGVLEGVQAVEWNQCKVIAAETIGASSFGQAWKEQALVRLPAIESIATSLGALEVTRVALERAQENGNVETSLCTDAEAVQACWCLARDHRVLVEPACGAALATLYSDRLREPFLKGLEGAGPIVVEVCGGSGVTMDLLQQWKQELLGGSG